MQNCILCYLIVCYRFAFVILPKNYREMDNFQKLCNCFQQNSFEYNITTIGGDGLIIENLT